MTKEEIIKIYKIIRKTLLVNGIFYRFSLKKNAALLDHNKFLEDPWPGDQAAGNNFINNVIKIRDFYVNADAIRFIDCNDNDFDYAAMYINSFAWIRDLQAVGGFETRKTIRYAIERFITQYRESLAFWKKPFFDVLIVSERIMNWLYGYSFFAIGADDNFQKLVLSSIVEQMSHIIKIYKYEIEPTVVLAALRTIIYCYSVFANKKNLQFLIKQVEKIVKKYFVNNVYFSKNPDEQFFILKLILEIRFAIKSKNNVQLSDVFYEKLSDIANYVRFTRMSDGYLAMNIGEISNYWPIFNAKSNIIDAVLSLIDNKIDENVLDYKKFGLEKIRTYNQTAIVNTHPSYGAAFECEVSFNTQKLINITNCILYSDKISLIKNNNYVQHTENFGNRIECELTSACARNKFAIRREISMDAEYCTLDVVEFMYCDCAANALVQIIFHKNTTIQQIDNTSAIITLNGHKYKLVSSANITIYKADMFTQSAIYIKIKLQQKIYASCTWKITETHI